MLQASLCRALSTHRKGCVVGPGAPKYTSPELEIRGFSESKPAYNAGKGDLYSRCSDCHENLF